MPRGAAGLALLAVLEFSLWCVAAAATADDVSSANASEVMVRVLLSEQRESVEVVAASGERSRIALDRSTSTGVRANGGPARSSWRTRPGRGPFRVALHGRTLRVRGDVLVFRRGDKLEVINRVPLEDYVAGTLGAEMYSSWKPDALRAQAVACRSYVLYQMNQSSGRRHDVSADVLSQVYRGIDSETDSSRAATRDTRAEILRHDGQPILAAFHSASGGRTASAEEVWGKSVAYLQSVTVDEEDDSPDAYWRAAISPRTLGEAAALLGHRIGDVREARVEKRSQSGRVLRISLRGRKGRAVVSGRELRQALGGGTLKSTLFQVRNGDGGVVFVGSGSGHGVGLSQWAAQAMAERGKGYREILRTFYPGTEFGLVSPGFVGSGATEGHGAAHQQRTAMGAIAQ